MKNVLLLVACVSIAWSCSIPRGWKFKQPKERLQQAQIVVKGNDLNHLITGLFI